MTALDREFRRAMRRPRNRLRKLRMRWQRIQIAIGKRRLQR